MVEIKGVIPWQNIKQHLWQGLWFWAAMHGILCCPRVAASLRPLRTWNDDRWRFCAKKPEKNHILMCNYLVLGHLKIQRGGCQLHWMNCLGSTGRWISNFYPALSHSVKSAGPELSGFEEKIHPMCMMDARCALVGSLPFCLALCPAPVTFWRDVLAFLFGIFILTKPRKIPIQLTYWKQ